MLSLRKFRGAPMLCKYNGGVIKKNSYFCSRKIVEISAASIFILEGNNPPKTSNVK
jgi:hypothetical protein